MESDTDEGPIKVHLKIHLTRPRTLSHRCLKIKFMQTVTKAIDGSFSDRYLKCPDVMIMQLEPRIRNIDLFQ
jgi:hypothetical protein